MIPIISIQLNVINFIQFYCRWLFMSVIRSQLEPIRLFSPSLRIPLRQALSHVQNSPDRKIRGNRNKIPKGCETENSSRSSRPLATVVRTLSSMIRVVFSSLLMNAGHTPIRSVPVSHIETVRHIHMLYADCIFLSFYMLTQNNDRLD